MSTLNGSFVPVLWWLHDAFAGYPFIAHKIPKTLGSNVHVCAVVPRHCRHALGAAGLQH